MEMKVIAIDVWKGKKISDKMKSMLETKTVRTLRYKKRTRYMFTHGWYPHAYSFYNDGLRHIWIYPEDYQEST
jgi:hypothetical protein